MKTLKYLVGAASVMMVASFAASPALAQVTGTPHDLTTAFTANAGTEQVCVYCHTPHNGAQGNTTDANIIPYNTLPLWNRQADAATIGVNVGSFQVYTSPTMDNAAGQPGGVSLGCLSCHDGATALDSLINAGEAAPFTVAGTVMPAGANVLGGDLRNDHPVSMAYAGGAAADWNSPPLNSLPLYTGNTVECGSCHNPHDLNGPANNTNNFLRISNNSSDLCLSCHVK